MDDVGLRGSATYPWLHGFRGMFVSAATRRRATAAVAVLVVALIAAVWLLWPDPDPPVEKAGPPPAQAVTAGSVLHPARCHRPAKAPFVPASITVPVLDRKSDVVPLPRDANNVPSAIPVSAGNAKTAYAWDAPTARPGAKQGNVLINAHTWPDGTALGNHLLDSFQVGDRIIVNGAHGEELCYKVTKRDVIRAADGSAEYYEADGPPQIALIVCSPPRLGPGNWVNRTIWYASPVGSPQARAVKAS